MTQPQNPYTPAANTNTSYGAQPGYANNAGAASAPNRRPNMMAAFGAGRNLWGLLSLGAAVLLTLASFVFNLFFALIVTTNGFFSWQLLSSISQGVSILLSLAALGFGLAGLFSANPSKWPAIAGTAIGASAVVGTVSGLLSSLVHVLI